MPKFTIDTRSLRLTRIMGRWAGLAPRWFLGTLIRWLMKAPPPPRDNQIRDVFITGRDQARIRLRIYQPAAPRPKSPVLLWMHGGGYIIGFPEQDDAYVIPFIQDVGLTVVSVDYRLAPEHPFPAPLEDCYAALRWLTIEAGLPGINPGQIAIGGSSAGGGLAAALAQLAHDRGEVNPVFQLLVYPMLDDRTACRPDIDPQAGIVWNNASNRFGWESYLQAPCGAGTVPAGAVPARRENLAGLPPAWIGVGTNDLFHDESAAYARRLKEAGTPCELVTIPGAFHGFDLFAPELGPVQDFRQSQVVALKNTLAEGRG